MYRAHSWNLREEVASGQTQTRHEQREGRHAPLGHGGDVVRVALDEVREVLAEEMLAAMPVEDVATRLGYAEASSFIHAFKRWKGVTPSTYTKHLRPH